MLAGRTGRPLLDQLPAIPPRRRRPCSGGSRLRPTLWAQGGPVSDPGSTARGHRVVHPTVQGERPAKAVAPRGGWTSRTGTEGVGMQGIKEAANAFLGHRRIAVTGVSRSPKDHGSNVVYKRLRDRGYEVFAVNPKRRRGRGRSVLPRPEVDPGRGRGGGDRDQARAREARCASASSSASRTSGCTAAGGGSVSPAATEYGRQHGVTVIDGGCPAHVRTDLGRRPQDHALHVHEERPKKV